ncbi:MAG: fibronectin type III domain-containing protein [Thermoplasmata archaeon]
MTKKSIVPIFLVALILISILSQLPLSNAQSSFSVWTIGQTETTISLEWNEVNVYASNGYVLYYSSQGTNGPFQSINITSPTTSTYPLTYLNPGTNYWIYVYTSWGGFTPSSETTTTIEVTTAPVPSLQSSSVTETTVSLSWTDYNVYSNLTNFQSYTVQMMPPSGSWSTLTTLTSQADTTYTVTGLSAGTSYSFRVYDTVYVSGVGTFSSTSNVVAASTVSNMNAMISASSASINTGGSSQLSASVSGGVGPYTYQWYVNGNPVSGATSSEFTFRPSSSGTYSVYVVVMDSSGTSQTSNAITITVSNSIIPIGPSSNSALLLIIIVIVVIIAIIGIAMALSRSKRKRMKM